MASSLSQDGNLTCCRHLQVYLHGCKAHAPKILQQTSSCGMSATHHPSLVLLYSEILLACDQALGMTCCLGLDQPCLRLKTRHHDLMFLHHWLHPGFH